MSQAHGKGKSCKLFVQCACTTTTTASIMATDEEDPKFDDDGEEDTEDFERKIQEMEVLS